MSTLFVCPLSRLTETVEVTGASHVVTLISPTTFVPRPASIAEGNHLVVGVNDIFEPTPGQVLVTPEHLTCFLDFVRGWERARPLVIHCLAGMSRSTAGAFIAACALAPDQDEAEIARRLRRRAPQATPNPVFVRIADDLLGRSGRMIAAAAAIGRGVEAAEGTPFALPLHPDDGD